MESIIRNVRDIGSADRRALEHVIGQDLLEDQQIVICVVGIGAPPVSETPPSSAAVLRDWCNVYEGLSDDQIAEIDRATSRQLDLTRSAE